MTIFLHENIIFKTNTNNEVTIFIKLKLQSHLLPSSFTNTIPISPYYFSIHFYLEFTVKAKWEHTLQTYCKRWCKIKEGVGVHAFNNWTKMNDIRIENCTKHPHLYKQTCTYLLKPVKSLKRKLEKIAQLIFFALVNKVANNIIIIWKKDTTLMIWRVNWILRVHVYCWVDERQTSFASYRYSH